MKITEIYDKGRKILGGKDFGFLMEYVETGFISGHDRKIIDRYTFLQEVIDAPDKANTACEVLGLKLKTPVIQSAITMPIPAIAEDGLLQMAEGLHAAGSLMWTGTPVPKDLEALKATGVPLACTIKPFADRKLVAAELERVQNAGVDWVGLEIDVAHGTKIKDTPIVSECKPLTLSEIKGFRKNISVPFFLKGVLSRADAEKAMESGADGIVISNHGGHTIDYLPHPFQVMDEIMESVRGNLAVVVDGGIRRGSDVLKGLAFGADLVGLGRPLLYALAAGEKEGVRNLVEEMNEEIRRIMPRIGASDPSNVKRGILLQDYTGSTS